MQQAGAREQVQYAGLAQRATAVVIDTIMLIFASSILLVILSAAGVVDLGIDRNATLGDMLSMSRAAPGWLLPVEYALVFAYFTLFELRGTTPGKRLLRLRVIADDGSQARPLAVVVRNIVRIPEMYFLYLPSAVSCLASGKNKRLGDLAAKTMVVRRSAGPVANGAPLPPAPPLGQAAVKRSFATAAPASPSTLRSGAAGPPGASEALAGLKTAALALRGAHLNYLRFSEVELAKSASASDPPAGRPDAEAEHEYSPEYAAAWYTLTDAVIAMQQTHAAAIAAATREGTSLAAVGADQPDLAYLFRELEPYFTAGSDDEVHDAYMSVARGETTA